MTGEQRYGGLKAPIFYLKHVCVICAAILLTVQTGSQAYAVSPLSGFNPAVMEAEAIHTVIDLKSFCADNALTLGAIFFDKWDGPFTPSSINNGDLYWYASTAYLYKGWRVAVFNRGELFLEADRDDLEILYMVKTKQELEVGRRFAVQVESEGFNAAGVELSKVFDLNSLAPGLKTGVTVRYLMGERVQHGTVVGSATPTGPKTYDFNLLVNYIYDDNLLYDRQNDSPGPSNGYSFDMGAVYTWNDFEVSVLARDLYGYIRWKEVPYTNAEAGSDATYLSSDGYQSFRPVIRGYEGYTNYTQKISVKTDVDVSYRGGPIKIGGTVNFIEDRPFYWLSMEYTPQGSERKFRVGYNTNYMAFTLGAAYKQFQLEFYSDNFSIDQATAFGFIMSCGMQW